MPDSMDLSSWSLSLNTDVLHAQGCVMGCVMFLQEVKCSTNASSSISFMRMSYICMTTDLHSLTQKQTQVDLHNLAPNKSMLAGIVL